MVEKRVSVGLELDEIELSIAAVAIILNGAIDGTTTDRQQRELPWAMLAAVNMVRRRLTLLRRAIAQDVDPATIWTPENDARESGDSDVILEPWSDAQVAEHAQRVRTAAATRIRERRRSQRPKKTPASRHRGI